MIRKSNIGMPYDFRRIGPNYIPEESYQGSVFNGTRGLEKEGERGTSTASTPRSNLLNIEDGVSDSTKGGTRPNLTAPNGFRRTYCPVLTCDPVSNPENFEHLAHIEDINSNKRNFIKGKASGDPAIQKMFSMVERNAAERRLDCSRERPKPPPTMAKPTLSSRFSYVSPATSKSAQPFSSENDVVSYKIHTKGEESFFKKNDTVNVLDDPSFKSGAEEDRQEGYVVPVRKGLINESTVPDSGVVFSRSIFEKSSSDNEDVRVKQQSKEVILLPTKKKLEHPLSEDSLKTPTPLTPFDLPFQTISEYSRARSAYKNITETANDDPVAPPRRKRTLENNSPIFYRKTEETSDPNMPSKIFTQRTSFTGEVNQALRELDDLLEEEAPVGTVRAPLSDGNLEVHSGDNLQKTKKTLVKDLIKKLGEGNADLMGMYKGNRWKTRESGESTKVQAESDVQNSTEGEVISDNIDNEAVTAGMKPQAVAVKVLGVHNEKTFNEIIVQKCSRKARAPLPPISPCKDSSEASTSNAFPSSRPIAIPKSIYDGSEQDGSISKLNGMQNILAKSAPADVDNFHSWKAQKMSENMREKLKMESIELEKFRKTNLEDASNEETQRDSKTSSEFLPIDPLVHDQSKGPSERSFIKRNSSTRKLYRALSGGYLNTELKCVNVLQSKPSLSKTKNMHGAAEMIQSSSNDSPSKEAQKQSSIKSCSKEDDEFNKVKSCTFSSAKLWLDPTVADDICWISGPNMSSSMHAQYENKVEQLNSDTANLDCEIRFSHSVLTKIKNEELQNGVTVRTNRTDEGEKSKTEGPSVTSSEEVSSFVQGNKNAKENREEERVSSNKIRIDISAGRDWQEGIQIVHKRTTASGNGTESLCSDEAGRKPTVKTQSNEDCRNRSEEEKENQLESKKVEERANFNQKISTGQRSSAEGTTDPKTSAAKDLSRESEDKKVEREEGQATQANVSDKEVKWKDTMKLSIHNHSKSADRSGNQKISQQSFESAKKEVSISGASSRATSKFQAVQPLGETSASNDEPEERTKKGVQRTCSIPPKSWGTSKLVGESILQMKRGSPKLALHRYATMQVTMSSTESEEENKRKSVAANELESLFLENKERQPKENKKESKQDAVGVVTQSVTVPQRPIPMPRRRFLKNNNTSESAHERGEGTKQQRPIPPPRPSLQQRKTEVMNNNETRTARLTEECLRL